MNATLQTALAIKSQVVRVLFTRFRNRCEVSRS
jgi:hypothetical protein